MQSTLTSGKAFVVFENARLKKYVVIASGPSRVNLGVSHPCVVVGYPKGKRMPGRHLAARVWRRVPGGFSMPGLNCRVAKTPAIADP